MRICSKELKIQSCMTANNWALDLQVINSEVRQLDMQVEFAKKGKETKISHDHVVFFWYRTSTLNSRIGQKKWPFVVRKLQGVWYNWWSGSKSTINFLSGYMCDVVHSCTSVYQEFNTEVLHLDATLVFTLYYLLSFTKEKKDIFQANECVLNT